MSTTANSNPSSYMSRDQTKDASAKPAATNTVRKISELTGRVLLASLFLLSGLGKIGAYTVTAGYMKAFGVPSALLPLVIATEVLGAIAIIAGWKTQTIAALLAGFTLLAAFIFHTNFGDQVQLVMFLKNVSIAGAFLLLVANGAGPLSLDAKRE